MLSNSKLPLSYWSYAVTTATHIINRLPTPWLHHKSPWELLFNSLPDLAHLGTYGCTCFPLLRSYNIHKLQPHTKPCIFLGYPAYFKGYICLEPFLFVYTYQDTSYSMKKKKNLSPESPPLFNGPSASSSLSPFSTFSAWFQYLLHTSPSPAHTSAYSRYIKSWQHYSPYYFYSTYIFYLLSYIHLFPNSLRLLLNFSHLDPLIPFNQSPIHHP